jgi:hypothetical protein
MPQISDIVCFHPEEGQDLPAVVVRCHPDEHLDLVVLSTEDHASGITAGANARTMVGRGVGPVGWEPEFRNPDGTPPLPPSGGEEIPPEGEVTPPEGEIPVEPTEPPVEPTEPGPDDPVPTHPIVIPPEEETGTGETTGEGGSDDVSGEIPIDVDTGEELPVEEQPPPEEPTALGALGFFQRKTLGIKWDPQVIVGDDDGNVAISVAIDDAWSRVRTVPNNGHSSVTFPKNFTGERVVRIIGSNGFFEGTATIK